MSGGKRATSPRGRYGRRPRRAKRAPPRSVPPAARYTELTCQPSEMSMTETRRLALFAEGNFEFHHGKTAMSILRYRPEDVVAVIDSGHAGATTGSVVALGGETPIVRDIEAALPYRPTALLIGVAPRGGGL